MQIRKDSWVLISKISLSLILLSLLLLCIRAVTLSIHTHNLLPLIDPQRSDTICVANG